MTDIPEGYVARDADAATFAVNSGTLLRTGEVHLNGGDISIAKSWYNNSASALDSHVELNINGDPRLEAIRAYAHELRDKYNNPESRDYISDVRAREKKIVDLIEDKIYDAYGSYSYETLKNHNNAGEKKATGIFYDDSAMLKDMEKGSLVCRHYAPIMSVCLEEAGVPNHLVVGMLGHAEGKQAKIDGNHAFVVTQQGQAVVEATVAGKGRSAYQPIVNGVNTTQVVVTGRAMITEGMYIYGGGEGSKDEQSAQMAAQQQLTQYQENEQKQHLGEIEKSWQQEVHQNAGQGRRWFNGHGHQGPHQGHHEQHHHHTVRHHVRHHMHHLVPHRGQGHGHQEHDKESPEYQNAMQTALAQAKGVTGNAAHLGIAHDPDNGHGHHHGPHGGGHHRGGGGRGR